MNLWHRYRLVAAIPPFMPSHIVMLGEREMGRGTRGVLGYWEDFYGHMRYSLNLTTAPLSYSSNLPKVLKRLLFSTLRDKSVIILKQIRPLENVVKLPL